MKRIILVMLVLFFTRSALSQDYEFGKVSKEELLEKSYDKDTSANAVVIYKHHDTYFLYNGGGVQVVTEMHERIKIYNKKGFDHATQVINLFKTRSTKETVSKIKAFTFNIKDGNIVQTKLDKNQIFKNEFSANYNQVKFTMPNVKEGSVIEFQYKTMSPYFYYIDELVLQYNIPIKKVIAEVRTPKKLLEFKSTHKGYISFYPEKSTKTDHRLGLPVNINTYTLTDVPAIVEEIYVGNIDNYTAGVLLEFVAQEIPGQFYKSYAKSWKDVASTIGSSTDYKKELDKTNSFDEELDALLKDKVTELDKMKALFNYVKTHIKWNGNDGKYFHNGIKKALKEHKGNVTDVNLSLVAMLRYAGIKANPVVISTKDNGIPLYPTVDRLNYVIAYAVIDEKPYFLDATDEFSDINLMPIKNYNWQGVYIDNKNKSWKLVDIKEAIQAVGQHQLKAKLSDDGSVEGTVNSKYSNHYAFRFRNSFKDQDLESFIGTRESDFQAIEISDYELKNIDKVEGKVQESFSFYQEDGSEVIGEDIYLEPFSFFKIDENPFKLEERLYPIDFGYPIKDQYLINFEMPAGYTTEINISPVILRTPEGEAEFRFSSRVVGNNIQISMSIEVKQAIISQLNYEYLKDFYNLIITKGSEKIILKKTQP